MQDGTIDQGNLRNPARAGWRVRLRYSTVTRSRQQSRPNPSCEGLKVVVSEADGRAVERSQTPVQTRRVLFIPETSAVATPQRPRYPIPWLSPEASPSLPRASRLAVMTAVRVSKASNLADTQSPQPMDVPELVAALLGYAIPTRVGYRAI
ncbi:uncharacterized protein THITE_159521 [Thermothielavioides terrestris NRRL 8126]|uniref:Uncharacterized protein n=1 Tax=Thermothielavioides terrestris (strain ATCC 38088 / NRRL 8126) TaxID=578455 RepID=G2RG07_THETT|nr:uncharacterized protein THITE_159521 [Thermothielavioides terrestris NRRL 8126]AEO71761.1 hypothetical protein THITE_159521 [Thermothielavioides terrestris NRRL 8126]